MFALSVMALLLPADLTVESGAHLGRAGSDEIEWRSVWVVERTTEIGTEQIRLSMPLHPGTRLEQPEDGELISDGTGRIVAIALPEHLWRIGRVELVTRQPRDGAADRLSPPIAAGSGIDRVVIAEGMHFLPSGAAGLEPHVGYWTTPGLSDALRERADQLAAGSALDGTRPLYVRGDVLPRGLIGEISPTAVSSSAPFAVGAAFVSLVLLLAGMHRGLARRAEVERAEAALHEELNKLET